MPANDLPAGYQRWLMYWFRCPACGYESSTAFATVPVPHNLKTLYRFRCASCGKHAVLKYPRRKGAVVLITFALVAAAFAAFIPNWLASGIAVSVVFPVAWAALNRLTRDYIPDSDA